jgi:hypothetical protein
MYPKGEFHMRVFSGVSPIRRPLVAELSAEDRPLARRWAIALPSVYAVIAVAIIAAVLAGSGADKPAAATSFDRKAFLQERSGIRLYGALPNLGQSVLACRDTWRCTAQAGGAGGER